MGGLFNINGKVYQFLEKVANYIIVSVLWVLFSLPIFTIGASSTALYYTFRQVICRDTGTLWKTFWSTFKGNFKQSTGLWLIWLVVIASLLTDCYVCYVLSGTDTMLNWILLLLAVLILFITMWSLYWFPYIAHIQDPIKAILKNTLIMCILNLPKSLLMLVTFAACIALFCVLPDAVSLLVILPAIYILVAHRILSRVFNQYWDME